MYVCMYVFVCLLEVTVNVISVPFFRFVLLSESCRLLIESVQQLSINFAYSGFQS